MSLVVHWSSPFGRDLGKSLLSGLVSDLIRGRVVAQQVDSLSLFEASLSNVRVFDPTGQEVIFAEHVVVEFDPWALLQREVRFRSGRVEGGRLRLIDSERSGDVSFLQAFSPDSPSDGTPSRWRAVVERLSALSVSAEGNLLSVEGLRAEDVAMVGRLDIDSRIEHGVRFRVWRAQGVVAEPFGTPLQLTSLTADVRDDRLIGSRLRADLATAGGESFSVDLHYGRPSSDEADILTTDIQVHSLEAQTFARSGFGDFARTTHGRVSGQVHFEGPSDRIGFRATIETQGGRVEANGVFRSGEGGRDAAVDVDVRARVSEMRVADIVVGGPDIVLTGEFVVERRGEESSRLHATLEPFDLGGWTIPSSRIDATLGEDEMQIHSAQLLASGAQMSAQGRVTYQGAVDLHLSGGVSQIARDPVLRRLLPDLRSRSTVNADVAYDSATGELAVSGRMILSGLRYGPLFVATAVVSGSASGHVSKPTLNLRASVRDVRYVPATQSPSRSESDPAADEEVPLGSGELRLAGPSGQYDATLALSRARQAVHSSMHIAVGSTTQIRVDDFTMESGNQRWRGHIGVLDLTASSVAIKGLEVVGDGVVRGHGAFRRHGSDQAVVEATGLDLHEVRRFWKTYLPPRIFRGLPHANGAVTGSASMTGDLALQPELHIRAEVHDFVTHPDSEILQAMPTLDAVLAFDYARGSLSSTVSLAIEQQGDVELELSGILPVNQPFREAVPLGEYRVNAQLASFDLDYLKNWLPPDRQMLSGRVTGALRISGTVDFFEFDSDLDVPELMVASFPPWNARLRLAYEGGTLVLRATIRDQQSEPVAEMEASVLLDLLSVLKDPSMVPTLLTVAPWRMAGRVPPRSLQELGQLVGRDLPWASQMTTAVSWTFRGGAYRPQGDLFANLAWTPADGEACELIAPQSLQLSARLSGGSTRATAVAFQGERRVGRMTLDADTPVAEWLEAPERFQMPIARAEGRLNGFRLQQTPALCEFATGEWSGNFVVSEFFSDAPSAQLSLFSESVRLADPQRTRRHGTVSGVNPAPAVSFTATLDRSRVRTAVEGRFQDSGAFAAEVEVPLLWESNLAPQMDERRWSGRLQATRLPLSDDVAPIPQIRDLGGVLDGEVRAEAHGDELALEGSLELSGGSLNILPLGQRLEDVGGSLIFERGVVLLQGLHARDGDGIARLAGEVTLSGFAPRVAQLELDALEFPFRQEGVTAARLTGEASLRAEFEQSGVTGRLQVDELSVVLPEQTARTMQPLESHPDVQIVGAEQDDGDEPYRIVLDIDAGQRFEIRGQDLGASLAASLHFDYLHTASLRGNVEVLRGHYDVFGKRFEVEHGSLVFDDEEWDPTVNLTAIHELRSHPGETITVIASGRMSAPEIRFSSTLVTEKADIIALLVSGEVRGSDAQDVERAPTEFLAGVMAGALSPWLRRGLGQIVPTIIVEGNRYGGTRVRGGWRLEDIIPESFRGFIQGVYVEGFFNTGGPGGSGDRSVGSVQDYGFVLELNFPRNVVNTNTFSPPRNFSFDVTWQP